MPNDTENTTADAGSDEGRVRPVDARICRSCSNLVTTDATCPLCDKPTKPNPFRDEKEGYCQRCAGGPFPTDQLHLVTWNENPHWQLDDGDLNTICLKSRAEQLEEESDDWPWQPIETATKDGTHILACNAAWAPYGQWQAPPTAVHWWSNPGEEGFYTSVNEREPEQPFPATHWMALPPPPPNNSVEQRPKGV